LTAKTESHEYFMVCLTRIFYALVVLAIVQTIYYYPIMPEVVASHFDGRGNADAWSNRNVFFGLYLAIVAMLAGIFIVLSRWSERRAQFGMKIPNREYWLAPQRIEQTRRFFRRQMMVMGVAHMMLAVYCVQLVINANFDQTPSLHQSIF
jgi:uncharacterized membrane protein